MPQAAPPKPPGVVNITTTITDTTERKTAFGRQARHVKTVMDIEPMPSACDTSKQHIETDGWYIDPPTALVGQEALKPPTQPQAQQTCTDEIKATMNGDPKLLGYPIAYTTTMTGADGKPVVASMEVTELELTTLDAALFEPPAGFTAAGSPFDLSKALSDVTEAKLVAADTAPPPRRAAKTPGVVRVGVPEFTNKTNMAVDTRRLRANLIDELKEQKIDAVPMAAARAGQSAEARGRTRLRLHRAGRRHRAEDLEAGTFRRDDEGRHQRGHGWTRRGRGRGRGRGRQRGVVERDHRGQPRDQAGAARRQAADVRPPPRARTVGASI